MVPQVQDAVSAVWCQPECAVLVGPEGHGWAQVTPALECSNDYCHQHSNPPDLKSARDHGTARMQLGHLSSGWGQVMISLCLLRCHTPEREPRAEYWNTKYQPFCRDAPHPLVRGHEHWVVSNNGADRFVSAWGHSLVSTPDSLMNCEQMFTEKSNRNERDGKS